MNRKKWIFGGLALLVLSCTTERLPDETIKNVSRIYMHQCGQYTFAVQSGDTVKLITRHIHFGPGRKEIILADVPKDSLDWAFIRWSKAGLMADFGADSSGPHGPRIDTMVIHINKIQDVDDAGWERYGKNLWRGIAKGRTNVFD